MEEDNEFLQAQERQQKGLRDQYNELKKYEAMEDYKHTIHTSSSLLYAIRTNESLQDYTKRLEGHIQILTENNTRIHIHASKGCWYQHKMPTCFCCADRNMYTYLLALLQTISLEYPKITPRT